MADTYAITGATGNIGHKITEKLLAEGHQVGSFIGVWLGGWLFDRSGRYDLVWWLGVALGIFAAFVHWPIRERPVKRVATETI